MTSEALLRGGRELVIRTSGFAPRIRGVTWPCNCIPGWRCPHCRRGHGGTPRATPAKLRSGPGRGLALAVCGGLLAVALLAGLLLGPAAVSPSGMLAVLQDTLGLAPLSPECLRDSAILGVVRAPRVLLAALIGGGLACAGAVMQGLFRNPLADPGLIGVSSGAALAAATAIVLSPTLFGRTAGLLGMWLLPVAAFLGGWRRPSWWRGWARGKAWWGSPPCCSLASPWRRCAMPCPGC